MTMTILGPLGCLKNFLIEGLFRITFTPKKKTKKLRSVSVFNVSTVGPRCTASASCQAASKLLAAVASTFEEGGLANPAHPGRALEDMYVSACLCSKGFLFGKLCKGDK